MGLVLIKKDFWDQSHKNGISGTSLQQRFKSSFLVLYALKGLQKVCIFNFWH